MSAELILFNGRIATLDKANPEATAVAVEDGRFMAVGAALPIGPERQIQ